MLVINGGLILRSCFKTTFIVSAATAAADISTALIDKIETIVQFWMDYLTLILVFSIFLFLVVGFHDNHLA